MNEERADAGWTRIPLVGLAVTFGIGTWFGFQFSFLSAWWFVTACVVWLAAVFAWCFARKPGAMGEEPRTGWMVAGRIFLLHGVIFCLAVASVRLRAEQQDALLIPLVAAGSVFVDVSGVVVDDPETVVSEEGRVRHRFQFSIETMRSGQARHEVVNGIVVPVFLSGVRGGDSPKYGDCWQLHGRFAEFGNLGRSGDRESGYGSRLFLHATMTGACRESEGHGAPWKASLYRWREAAGKYLAVGIEDQPLAVAISRALVLGYRGEIPAELKQAFVTSGTLHIFAISGLHVVMIAGLIVFLLRILRVSRVYWTFVLLPVLVGYTIATGASASAVRACVMTVVCIFAVLVHRKPNGISALALSFLLLLMADPRQLFDPGFVLSFGVTLGIMILYPLLQNSMRKVWEKDPLLIEDEPRFVEWRKEILKAVAATWNMSLAAWIVSLPWMMLFFERVSLVALFANLIVVPLSFLVLLCGCLALVFGPCVAWVADVLNHASVVLIGLMSGVVQGVSVLPGACVETRSVSSWFVASYFLLLGLIVHFVKSRAVPAQERDAKPPEASSQIVGFQ